MVANFNYFVETSFVFWLKFNFVTGNLTMLFLVVDLSFLYETLYILKKFGFVDIENYFSWLKNHFFDEEKDKQYFFIT